MLEILCCCNHCSGANKLIFLDYTAAHILAAMLANSPAGSDTLAYLQALLTTSAAHSTTKICQLFASKNTDYNTKMHNQQLLLAYIVILSLELSYTLIEALFEIIYS